MTYPKRLRLAFVSAALAAGVWTAPALAMSDADIEALDRAAQHHAHGEGKAHSLDDGHDHGDEFAPNVFPLVLERETVLGEGTGAARAIDPNPFPSSYAPYPSEPVAITGATVLTGTGARLENATVVIQQGRIAAVGADIAVPEGIATIDATGKWVTPGIIDIHSHLGVYPSPGAQAHSDGNEIVGPNTAHVWAEHSVWPQDPGFTRALAGGITALHILPGSANLFGGRGVTMKNVPSRTVQGMKFPDAPYTLKMACGENPKRVYGTRGRAPYTRMGNVAGYRQAWADAAAYDAQWDAYEEQLAAGEDAKPPRRNLTMDTLRGVLDGEILVQMHCYRADEMVIMLDVAREFNYRITTFHHAIEAYKVADYLEATETCAAMWADWWGFKLEAYDSVRENVALVEQAGACTIIHSDSDQDIQRLNQEAAKAMADGARAGIDVPRETAIAWITANPARALGIFQETGSLEAGKAGDVVIWNRDPFSVYAQAEHVFVDGALLYERGNDALSPRTDFEIGQQDNANTGGAGQ